MTRLLRLRPQADRDIDALVEWLKADSPAAAVRLLDLIEAAFERIERFPDAGSTRHADCLPDLPVPLRFHALSVGRFPTLLIYYLCFESHIDIVRVWDAARGLDALIESTDDAPT